MAAGTWALERVAADDGAEPAPIADGPDLIQDRVVVLLGRSFRLPIPHADDASAARSVAWSTKREW